MRRGKCFSRKPGNEKAALEKPRRKEEGGEGRVRETRDRESEERQAVRGETGSQRRDRQSEERQAV